MCECVMSFGCKGYEPHPWNTQSTQIDLNKWKLKWTLSLPQTSRANPVQCCSTHQTKCMGYVPHPWMRHDARVTGWLDIARHRCCATLSFSHADVKKRMCVVDIHHNTLTPTHMCMRAGRHRYSTANTRTHARTHTHAHTHTHTHTHTNTRTHTYMHTYSLTQRRSSGRYILPCTWVYIYVYMV